MPNIGYDFSGLLVSSPLKLYGLRPIAGSFTNTPDIAISLDAGALPPRRPVTFDWKGRFQLTLEGGGGAGWTIRYGDDLAINCDSRGRSLGCICRDPAQANVLTEILLRRILPRLTSLHGRMPVHAAGLTNDAGAILIFGHSGAGKSTLTAAMAGVGWEIMSDDMSILSNPDTSPHVWQTSPGVSLWEPSRRGLGLPEDQCRPIEGYDGKYWFVPPHAVRSGAVPVRAIIFLSEAAAGEDVTWQRTTGPRALVMAAMQMVQFDPASRTEGEKALANFTRLVERIPCYTLACPRRYDALPRIIQTISTLQADARSRARL